ncbi:MAG: hypothetical protein ACR2LG_07415 [Actinomycetota bacterium]
MSWDPLPSTFEKARRKEAYRRFAGLVIGKPKPELPELDDIKSRIRLFDQTYVGLRPIPVARIAGTAGRRTDFTKSWLPARPEVRDRWVRLEKAFPEGGFPPIVAYEFNGSYYVVDGHHRVALAKQKKIDFIDAEITQLRAPYPIPENADIGKLITAEQENLFFSESELERARPEARIKFSLSRGYVELLEIVKIHGYHLMRERDEVLSPEEISGDWYDRVYMPAVSAIRDEGLTKIFTVTEADAFLYIWQRRRAIFPERGGMTLEDTVRTVSAEKGGGLGPKARRAARRLRPPQSEDA